MFYLLVTAIPPYFLAEVFCELVGPVCWFHVTHPSQDKDIVFWSMAFPSVHTHYFCSGFLTDLLPEFWSLLFF